MARPGRKNRVKELGVRAEQIVHQKRADNEGYREIADELEELFGESISHEAVRNYVKNHSDDRMRQISEQGLEEIKKQELQKILDVGDQLESLNDKLQNAIDSLDEEEPQNMGVLVQLAREARKQLKFHKEYVEEVVNPTTVEGDVNVTQNYTAMEINNYLMDLEDEGIIEIKKPEKLDDVTI